MKKIFNKRDILETRVCEKYLLNEELLMENAAAGVAHFIKQKLPYKKSVTILCGGGNNGADGYALSRMLVGYYDVSIMQIYPPKSRLALLQEKRAKSLGIKFIDELCRADLFLDAIFGSGQREDMDEVLKSLILRVNDEDGLKIACDMPTGLFANTTFKADFTITMGALSEPLYYDYSKDFTGEIICVDLGVGREFFEDGVDTYLLEKSDMRLPIREMQNTNKGDFGYLSVIKGQMSSASILSAQAGFNLGAGLVSLVGEKTENTPLNIMQNKEISPKTTAVIAGMGLGEIEVDINIFKDKPCVLDADLLHNEKIKDIIKTNKNCVLTPHPKEFVSLYKIIFNKDITVEQVLRDKFRLAREFTKNSAAVLVLKGANTIVAQNGELYLCNLGNSSLAKGGSGDVLCGFIGSLLAQNYGALNAAINGVLVHSLIADKYSLNNYSLSPQDLIEGVKWL